jgi:hypothetical protein
MNSQTQVPEASAILEEFEDPELDEDQIRSINLARENDHMGLCRFASPSDPVFKNLVEEIERLTKGKLTAEDTGMFTTLQQVPSDLGNNAVVQNSPSHLRYYRDNMVIQRRLC